MVPKRRDKSHDAEALRTNTTHASIFVATSNLGIALIAQPSSDPTVGSWSDATVNHMRRTAAEAAQTRSVILSVGRTHFARGGFAPTSLDVIAAAANVTRGAVHHHFGDKTGLFREVLEQITLELNDAIVAAAGSNESDPWTSFVEATTAYLQFTSKSDYVQIAVHDAPAVLGRTEHRSADGGVGMATMGAAIKILCDNGILAIAECDRAPLTALLFGALTEASRSAACRPDAAAIYRDAFIDLVLRFRAAAAADADNHRLLASAAAN